MDLLFGKQNPPSHARGVIPGCEADGNVPAGNGRPNREERLKEPCNRLRGARVRAFRDSISELS